MQEMVGKWLEAMAHFQQTQKGLDTDTNVRVAEQIQIWLQATPLQIPWVNSSDKAALSIQECSLPEDTIKMENTEKQDNLITESHSSSSASSCSCKSFLFHQNGTASGFIKIYELNHRWKYKTLVGAQGEVEGRGSRRREKKRWCRLEKTRKREKEEMAWERNNRKRWREKDKRKEIGGFWWEQMSRLDPKKHL